VPDTREWPPTPWLERELASGLKRVTPPGALWREVEAGVRPERTTGWRIVWPAAAAAMLVLAAATAWQFVSAQDIGAQLRQAAGSAITGDPLSFHTGSCAELRDWLRQNAGMDVPLPAAAPAVELRGARVTERRGNRIAAIAYRVAGSAATLFVARRRSGAGAPHNFTQTASMGDGVLVSWRMRDLEYALVSENPGDPHAGCRLCHAR